MILKIIHKKPLNVIIMNQTQSVNIKPMITIFVNYDNWCLPNPTNFCKLMCKWGFGISLNFFPFPSVQAQVWPIRQYSSHDRFQLRTSPRLCRTLTQPHISRLGCWRPRKDPALVEAVHTCHRCNRFCRRFLRIGGSDGGSPSRAASDNENLWQHGSSTFGKFSTGACRYLPGLTFGLFVIENIAYYGKMLSRTYTTC